ncbi:unnamed protein product [Vitrella brassicaformis CCMP3155]|uniref:Uncharacterized protein n=1 Tax=Vitrella brassicaformis (strain CCMP3155) TaxID=1169540 RepID=A0A0G4EPL5_VITBC|nr:unnamed protein product [Vitrella brassicaformis CCMP3155]|eukprot:CEL99501.1 unnamed protein product [Vitrella brassicaformis CCMP3155]
MSCQWGLGTIALSKKEEKKARGLLQVPASGHVGRAKAEKWKTKLWGFVQGQLETIVANRTQMKLNMLLERVKEGALRETFRQLRDIRLQNI